MVNANPNIMYNRKNKLKKILNNIKQILDTPTGQKDIQLLYETIEKEYPDILKGISPLKSLILSSNNEIFKEYNKRLLKNISRKYEI